MIAIGAEIRVAHSYGWPAQVATAVVLGFEPYRGQGGYRFMWNYGRPIQMWESSGGWLPASMIQEVLS